MARKKIAAKAAPPEITNPVKDSRVQYWLDEVDAAKRREEDYRTDGKKILEIYYGKRKEETPFNILYSNTETIFPALYSQVPRPVVERRFKDDDPVAKISSEAGKRVLAFLMDTNVEGYETFDQGMRAANLDALLPGRGITCVRYDADIGTLGQLEEVDSEGAEKEPEESNEVEDGEEEGQPEPEETPYKRGELICLDHKTWNKVYFGYAKKWSKMPWICYEEEIDREEAERLFGDDVAGELKYVSGDKDEKKQDSDTGKKKTATIYQIWSKVDRTIYFVSPQNRELMLKELKDPLGLTGFYSTPQPLQFMEKSDDLTPTALYSLYENQAEELNRLTVRINKIVQAIKARGLYDSALGADIKNLMDAMDNELVPAEMTSSMAAEKGLSNSIWFMPIEALVATLRELIAAREGAKQTIYEIMGIADIMRGASNASETLGAQQIKQNWGNLRLKRIQKEVQRYARDLIRIMLEMAATKFSAETWKKMTGLPYPTAEEKQMAMQALRMMPPPPPVQPGQQPPPPSPEMQKMQQTASMPSWDEILGVLQDDIQRAYRIDIETNSTVEPEAAEDQKNIQELLTAIGQFMQGIGPLVMQGVMPFQAAQAWLLAITRRYRFGDDVEDYIKQMQPPQQPDPQAQEQAKQEAETKRLQMQQQHEQTMEQFAVQRDTAKSQAEAQVEAARVQAQSDADARIAADKEKHATDRFNMEMAAKERMHSLEIAAKERTEQKKHQMSLAHEKSKAMLHETSQQKIALINARTKQAATDGAAIGADPEEMIEGEGPSPIQQLADSIRMLAEATAKQTPELVAAILADRMVVPQRDASGRMTHGISKVIKQ